jgi:hypothetical protein
VIRGSTLLFMAGSQGRGSKTRGPNSLEPNNLVLPF